MTDYYCPKCGERTANMYASGHECKVVKVIACPHENMTTNNRAYLDICDDCGETELDIVKKENKALRRELKSFKTKLANACGIANNMGNGNVSTEKLAELLEVKGE